jgi:hypothetical protein
MRYGSRAEMLAATPLVVRIPMMCTPQKGPTGGIERHTPLFLSGGLVYNDFKYSPRSLISCSLRSRPQKAL